MFDYVVLDEAQAIKNAATATAKAARLLRARHRLALTGTPIENHLGELHSLFDFLNPGLSATGVTSMVQEVQGVQGVQMVQVVQMVSSTTNTWLGSRAGVAALLLRRTKEHVTPELPARTEETLYCELEGEQHRIYQQLRDHYRSSPKTIERDGFARSKFQILEARAATAAGRVSYLLLPAVRSGDSAKFDLLLPRLIEVVGEGRKALVFSTHKLARVVEASARCRARCLRVSRWTDTRP